MLLREGPLEPEIKADLQNKCLTAILLQQGYRYHKLRKTFSKFYRIHYELIDALSEPEFNGVLVYKFKKLIGRNVFFFFSVQNHNTLQTYRL